MKLEKIKSEKQLPIGKKLLKAESSVVGHETKRVTLWFEDDIVVELGPSSYSDCLVAVTAAPVLEDRYRVVAALEGISMTKTFKKKSDDAAYENKLTALGDGIVSGRSMVKVDEDAPDDSDADDEIPF